MDEMDVAVKLEVHGHEINSLKNQVSDLKEEYEMIQELAIAVNKMAVNIENMLPDQQDLHIFLNQNVLMNIVRTYCQRFQAEFALIVLHHP